MAEVTPEHIDASNRVLVTIAENPELVSLISVGVSMLAGYLIIRMILEAITKSRAEKIIDKNLELLGRVDRALSDLAQFIRETK